jgi:dephospho-CoA kinase
MMIVGITGGVGSGKTTVCKIFSVLGVPVFNADFEAKELYRDEAVIKKLKENFRENIFTNEGKADTRKIASMVFGDEKKLALLNSIIHPLVKIKFDVWQNEQHDAVYVLEETAILFETQMQSLFDLIITVTAAAETRMKRVTQRDNRSNEEINKIISRQWSDEEKIKHSDFIIINDETQLVIPQVLSIHQKISEMNSLRK